MSHPRSRYSALLVALFLALLVSTTLHADIRARNVCASILPFPDGGDCFVGENCFVGARGAFLDLTDRVTASGVTANASIRGTGVDSSPIIECVPAATSSREGWVSVWVKGLTTPGSMTLTLSRPNLIGGRDTDTIRVDVKRGFFVKRSTPAFATAGTAKVFEISGLGLNKLKVLQPEAGDEIVTRSATKATVKLTFARRGDIRLDQKLGFDGVTSMNDAATTESQRWPVIDVRAAAAPSTGSTGSSGVSSNQPNIKASAPSALFKPRDIPVGRGLRTGKVDDTFCSGFAANEVRTLPLRPFTFTITNVSSINVTQTFIVEVLGGGRVLHSESVAGLAARATKNISVGSFRQAPIPLKNKQPTPCPPPGPCSGPAGEVHGCYVDSGRPAAEPSVVIRIDAARAIPNEVTGDNSLGVN